MAAEVALTDYAAEDLEGLDRSAQLLVIKGLFKLAADPAKRGKPLGSKAGGNLTGFRCLVVGNRDYRIVYQVLDDGSLAVVSVIARRGDDECYKLAVARMQLHSDQDVRDLAVPLKSILDPE